MYATRELFGVRTLRNNRALYAIFPIHISVVLQQRFE